MSKTVYVEVTSNYSRSTWDDLGSTNYNPGDRVDYFDGSRNRIFVCINSNNSTTEPQNNPTDWAPAGSEEYPFLLIDSTNNLRVTTNSEWTLHGISSSTVNFLVEELGTWTPDNPVGGNATYQADGAGGTIILGDGRYTWDYSTYAMWWPNNCTIQAKNKQKAYIISNIWYWGGNNVTWKDVVFYNSGTTNVVPGSYSTGFKHNLDSCLSTQETPWGTLTAAKQEPSNGNWTRTLQGSWNGGYIRGCTFDYQYKGSSFLFNLTGGTGAVFENNTFYIRVKHSQYELLYNTGGIILKNNIFYIKYLQDGHGTQNFTRLGSATKGDNVVYLENDSDVGGTINNNLSGGITINPEFIDLDKSNFALRPSSPLIGGLQTGNVLSQKHPSGVWVDSAHTEINASYSFSLDTGDGSNYTFSGDATGTDPSINANIRDTLVFTNTTGAHALAIYNSQGIQVASEASGTTTFTPKYPDTYYYQCTVPGHENMRGDIVVTLGALGSYEHPFESYHDAIDSGYYNSKMILLFKEGDHLMSWYPGTNHTNNPGISSSFPGGLSFVGEDSETTRFTTGDNFNSYAAFYVGASLFSGSSQSQTPLTIEDMGFYINNTSGYLNRGLFSGVHWKSFTLKRSKVTCDLGGTTNSGLFDYFSSVAPAGYEFNLSGCEMNVPISDNNGPGGSFLSGDPDIKYTVNSCSFTKLDGYNYVHNGPSPIMIGGAFSSSNGSEIKNCIFYSNTGGDFSSSSVIASGVFSSCIFYSATDSFTNLPPDMDVNSAAEPLFINTLAGSEDLRSRPDSSAIGGIFKSKYPADTIWVQSGTGSGTGTEGDPFYWSEYSEAFLAAVQSSSNQIVFKDGQYVWTSAILQDDNVGNNITMISENIHQAIFTDAGRISSATKYPTLRFKGIQLVANDHFTWQQECHYILDSVHVLAGKYMGARSVTASGCIFEVPLGVNAYIFSSTGLVDITNCIFVDHNDRTSTVNYLTGATTGTIKNTIFYTKNPRTYCINPDHNAVLTNCASENITNPEDGVVFNENLGFLDIDNKNYKLRPSSVLIGRGK